MHSKDHQWKQYLILLVGEQAFLPKNANIASKYISSQRLMVFFDYLFSQNHEIKGQFLSTKQGQVHL